MTSSSTPSRPGLGNTLGPASVTERLRQQARANPGQFVYVIDPEFDPEGAVPGWAVRGYYCTTAEGTIDTGGWVTNPDYRPGPLTLGWPRPRNRVERALQLAAAGHQPDAVLLAALAESEVIIPTADGQIPILAGDDGQDTVAMFTSPEHLDDTTPRRAVAVAVLLPLLPTVSVVINPGRVPSARVDGTALADAVSAAPSPSHRPKP